MSKPAFIKFVGVQDLSGGDVDKLPKDVRSVYQQYFGAEKTSENQELLFETTVDGLVIEGISDGVSSGADTGQTLGFGVVFDQGWYDSGVAGCDPKKIADAAERAREGLARLFVQWGIEVKPHFLSVCVWRD